MTFFNILKYHFINLKNMNNNILKSKFISSDKICYLCKLMNYIRYEDTKLSTFTGFIILLIPKLILNKIIFFLIPNTSFGYVCIFLYMLIISKYTKTYVEYFLNDFHRY